MTESVILMISADADRKENERCSDCVGGRMVVGVLKKCMFISWPVTWGKELLTYVRRDNLISGRNDDERRKIIE